MHRLVCLLLAATALGGGTTTAFAAADEDPAARLAAVERENGILRRENAALRERERLQRENARLREKIGAQPPLLEPAQAPPPPSQRVWVREARPAGAAQSDGLPRAATAAIVDPLVATAYGADAGLPLKAPPRLKGEFNVFVEGGAFWTGGDPARTFPIDVADPFASDANPFNLNPRLGWDVGLGFDYRFAGSPWHVSAQFRYGEAKTSDSDASAFGPTVVLIAPGFFNTTAAAQTTASNRERHWLVDFAVGRDLNVVADAIQVKFGVRVVELTSRILQVGNTSIHATQFPFVLGGGFVDEVSGDNIEQNASFRGAGPRLGVEGTIPLAGGWQFDYLAGAAVLFGTRRFELTDTFAFSRSSNVLIDEQSISRFRQVDQKGATVANVDLQAGFGYWVTPNFRVNASYRLDAYFGALTTLDVAQKQRAIDRYFHGPRVTATARF